MYSFIPLKSTQKADISGPLLRYGKNNLTKVCLFVILYSRRRVIEIFSSWCLRLMKAERVLLAWQDLRTIILSPLSLSTTVLLVKSSIHSPFLRRKWQSCCSLIFSQLVSRWSGMISTGRTLQPHTTSHMKRRVWCLTLRLYTLRRRSVRRT